MFEKLNYFLNTDKKTRLADKKEFGAANEKLEDLSKQMLCFEHDITSRGHGGMLPAGACIQIHQSGDKKRCVHFSDVAPCERYMQSCYYYNLNHRYHDALRLYKA